MLSCNIGCIWRMMGTVNRNTQSLGMAFPAKVTAVAGSHSFVQQLCMQESPTLRLYRFYLGEDPRLQVITKYWPWSTFQGQNLNWMHNHCLKRCTLFPNWISLVPIPLKKKATIRQQQQKLGGNIQLSNIKLQGLLPCPCLPLKLQASSN